MRIAALSGLHVTYVWTHDSVGLGEDGPTHQPVEHYAALRAIPNLWFVRPGDGNEAAAAWALAVERPSIAGAAAGPGGAGVHPPEAADAAGHEGERARGRPPRRVRPARGDGRQRRELILIGTGSELALCVAAAEALEADGIPTRVVSLPCWERFEAQDAAYRDGRPAAVRAQERVTVEAGVSQGWERWAGDEGAILGLDRFGASAPAGTIFTAFGFTADNVADVGRRVVREGLRGRVGVSDPSIGHAARPRRLRRRRCGSRSRRTMPGPRSRRS